MPKTGINVKRCWHEPVLNLLEQRKNWWVCEMIEADKLLSFCVVCRWIFRRDGCEWCHYNFLKPISPLPPSDNEGPLKAVKMRFLPQGWVVGHGVERVCAFIAYYNKGLDSTVLTCCRSFGSIIQVEVQFWKAKTLVHAMSFDDFQTANKYALEYMQDITDACMQKNGC